MHRLIFVVLLFAVGALISGKRQVSSSEVKQEGSSIVVEELPYTLEEVIAAMIDVESYGRNDFAVGDLNREEKAYGCLQARQPAVNDYNKWNETSHQAKDCLGNRTLSVTICKWYLGYYATEKRLGRKPTSEDLVRIWNGGPNGYKKSDTLDHWEKVKKTLAKQREQ